MRMFFLLFLLSLTSYGIQAEEYYRSLDGTGKIHYGDAPLPDAADIDKIKPSPVPGPDDAMPYAMRQSVEKNPVTLYIADNCGNSCQMALDYLNKRAIPYTIHSLSTNEEIDTFKKASRGDRIPTMHIRENWLKGFSRELWDKELDLAGYPQQAPYGFHPVIKTATPAEKPKSE